MAAAKVAAHRRMPKSLLPKNMAKGTYRSALEKCGVDRTPSYHVALPDGAN
jgi:hypothetical protein